MEAATMTHVLEARGVAAGYKGHPIVEGLDLTVAPGEVVTLVGPNGAGKSTTLLTLSGVLPLIDGEVRFLGEPTTAPVHRRAKQGLAFVPETRGIFMQLSTRDNLAVGRADQKAALELFPELKPLLGRRAGALSGGEQQMVSLARALAREPKLLMVDELSMGLAPLVVQRLLEAVRNRAKERDVGVLLVEQHVQQALQFSDRVYVLRRGTIVMQGTVDEVAAKLHTAYL
jgi:branched-chain amino acid transport system ATP-binding protein